MYNKHRGESISVPLKEGTKTVKKLIRFDTNALAELEGVLGIKSMLAVLESPEKVHEHFGFSMLRAMVWAGLKGAGSAMTLEEVGESMQLTCINDYSKAIAQALTLATRGAVEPDAVAKEADEVVPPTSGVVSVQ